MLESRDREWQDAGTRRQAFYTDLKPGHYRFRVTACNSNGVWNQTGASLDFVVLPAYYQTNWFLFFCFAAFIALLSALHRWRVHRLASQEKRLRDVVETIPAMTFTALSKGFTTFVNKRWTEYTGLSVEQSAGTGWQRVIHAEDLVRYTEKWRISVATGQLFEDEARYRSGADGEYRWFLVRCVPLRDQNGNILRWYGTLTDIEDRKRAEQEREKLRQIEADLAHTNRVSTLGEMAASLAHEIKQPIAAAITSANSCVEWLTHDPPNLDRACAAAARIDKYGNRAAEIIDRIRSLYRKSPPLRHQLSSWKKSLECARGTGGHSQQQILGGPPVTRRKPTRPEFAPQGDTPFPPPRAGEAKTDVYGYLLAGVSPNGTVRSTFRQVRKTGI